MTALSQELVLTLLPLLIVIFLDAADGSYFHGVFRALETDLNLSLSHLGYMEGATSIAVVIFSPMWAYVADKQILDRKMLLICSMIGWGLTSLVMGFVVTSFWQLMVFRFINTAFVCSALPITQYFVASMVPAEQRGQAFGLIGIGASIGGITCNQFSTTFSETVLFGVAGWRFGLYFLGVLAISFSAILQLTMKAIPKEERFSNSDVSPMGMLMNLKDHWRFGSFRVLVCQGCFGALAWQVMTFSTMWFQYCGIADAQAGFISSCMGVGGLIGALSGGWLSDQLYTLNPYHGRQYMAQFSVGSAVPLLAITFTFVPRGPESVPLFAMLMCLFGCSVGMCVPGVNKPILAQLAPKDKMASMMAWEFTMEKVIGFLFGPLVITWLAAASGYEQTNQKVEDMSPEVRQHNVEALAFVIRSFACCAYACVAIGYTALHFTFKRDLEMKFVNDKEMSEEDCERAPLVNA